MKTNSVRSVMLAEYSVRVKILMEYIQTINPFGPDICEVERILAELGESLRFSPFVGLVVKNAPTVKGFPTVGNVAEIISGEISCKIQGEEFCNWFNNLCQIEIKEPKEGDIGFQLYEISPSCNVRQVVFFDDYGWLSDVERRQLRETDPKFVSTLKETLSGKPLRRCPKSDNVGYFDTDDILTGSALALNARAYRLVSLKPFQVEEIILAQTGWQKIK